MHVIQNRYSTVPARPVLKPTPALPTPTLPPVVPNAHVVYSSSGGGGGGSSSSSIVVVVVEEEEQHYDRFLQ